MKAWCVILGILLLLLQLRLLVGEGSLAEVRRIEQQIAVQQQENQMLRARNELLRAEVIDLKTNLHAVEERARTELGMIREGETFFLLTRGD